MLGVFLKTLGAGYSRKGREEDALRLYDEAGRLYPGLPDVHYNAGVSLQKLGRLDEAAGKYRRALDLDPEMAAARDNLSILLAGKGRYDEAIAEARRAVELEPWNAAARGNLAAAYCGCGRLDEGIREYRMAVEIDPAEPEAPVGARARVLLPRVAPGRRFRRGASVEALRIGQCTNDGGDVPVAEPLVPRRAEQVARGFRHRRRDPHRLPRLHGQPQILVRVLQREVRGEDPLPEHVRSLELDRRARHDRVLQHGEDLLRGEPRLHPDESSLPRRRTGSFP